MGLAGVTLEGRYKVIRPIARGALATVHLAFDVHGTPYALKVFPKGFEGRADREWRVGQMLDNPRVNPVLARLSVPEGDTLHPAVLLAYAPGARLSQWRGEHPGEALPVFAQLLEALAYLHAKGIVHRDIKPDNLVVDGSGEARLVDFDLAGPSGERFTQKVRLGTLAYIAPEQVRGQSPTYASDLYSAGVLLYWLVAGELPYMGEPLEVMQAHLDQPIPPLTPDPATGLEGSRELQAFIQRLMAKDPAGRYPNAEAALAEFRSLLQASRV